ncbi:helix-turn-helix transcriptional regulator [Haloarchaeobius sp. DFWS5]|uniref:helix-turn-helix transcriptional regulator n=1 Tax=Haloarchaeobius sp. DFWS5 TaxID=3446114 RepID=UPI003EB6E04D
MESALEEIEFLALSSNRVTVLSELSDGSRTRSALAEATGASQATLGRILEDFQDRSWIRRDGGSYIATPTGELVSNGFTNLLTILDTERDLRDVVPYLPVDSITFDLSHLTDATVIQPTETRPGAPLQRALELAATADEMVTFSHAFNNQSLAAVEERVTEGSLSFYGVFSQSAIDALTADSELCHLLAALVDASNAEIHVRDEDIPLAVLVADDVVHLLLRDDRGVLQGSIETRDETILAWANDRFEQYWEASRPLDRAELAK